MTNEELLEAQRALEDESRALGVARYRKNREASWQNILDPNLDEASLPPNRRLLRRYLGPTRDAISEFMDGASAGKAGRRHTAHKLLPGAAPIALAFLTLRSAINSGSQRLRLQRASLNVADAVLLHLRTKAFQDANHVGAAGLQLMLNSRGKVTARTLQLAKKIQRKEGVAIEWTLREKLLVGVKLLELARDATGLFDWPLLEEGFGARRTGKRATFVQKLSVAEKLVDFPAIYFPHNLDWRGRCYPIPKGGPEPQGNDIARGLLTFAQGFLSALQDSGARFIAADMPEANELTVHIMAAVAQAERQAISKRTKDALGAAKAAGRKLGNPNGAAALRKAGKGNSAAVERLKAGAESYAQELAPVIADIQASGVTSLGGIAAELNARHIQTRRGGRWYASGVANLLARVQSPVMV